MAPAPSGTLAMTNAELIALLQQQNPAAVIRLWAPVEGDIAIREIFGVRTSIDKAVVVIEGKRLAQLADRPGTSLC